MLPQIFPFPNWIPSQSLSGAYRTPDEQPIYFPTQCWMVVDPIKGFIRSFIRLHFNSFGCRVTHITGEPI